jgi:hypothetical protein
MVNKVTILTNCQKLLRDLPQAEKILYDAISAWDKLSKSFCKN